MHIGNQLYEKNCFISVAYLPKNTANILPFPHVAYAVDFRILHLAACQEKLPYIVPVGVGLSD